jgi:hypothetical protein
MSNCINSKCELCHNLVISTGISVVAVDGVDTLVIDIPAGGCYCNGKKICLVIAQTIPETATINQPVAISIGGDTTVVYPIVDKCCRQTTACQFRTRKKYPLRIQTNATTAVFKSLGGLSCCPTYQLDAIPAPATTAGGAVAPAVAEQPVVFRTVKAKTATKTDKGVEE